MKIRASPTNFQQQPPIIQQHTQAQVSHMLPPLSKPVSPSPHNHHRSPPTTRFIYQSPPKKTSSQYMMHLIPQGQPISLHQPAQAVVIQQCKPNSSPVKQFGINNSSTRSQEDVYREPSKVQPIALQMNSKTSQIARSRAQSQAPQQAAYNGKQLEVAHHLEYRQPVPPSSVQRHEQIVRTSQNRANPSLISQNRSARSLSQQNVHITIQMGQDSPAPLITVKQSNKGSVVLPQVIRQESVSQHSNLVMQNRPKIVSNYSTNSYARAIVRKVQNNNWASSQPQQRKFSFQQNVITSLDHSHRNATGSPLRTQTSNQPQLQLQTAEKQTKINNCVQMQKGKGREERKFESEAYYTTTQDFKARQLSSASTSKPKKPFLQQQNYGNFQPVAGRQEDRHIKEPYYQYYNIPESQMYRQSNKYQGEQVNQYRSEQNNQYKAGYNNQYKAGNNNQYRAGYNNQYREGQNYYREGQNYYRGAQNKQYKGSEAQYYKRGQNNQYKGTYGLTEQITEHYFSSSRRLVNEIFENETNRALLILKSAERKDRSRRKHKY